MALVGVLFCAAFVAISFSLWPRDEEVHVLLKADRLTRPPANCDPSTEARR